MTEAWIIDAVRSPRGKGKPSGALHNVHPQRILAQVLNALQARNGFDTAEVDDVIMGCGAGSGDHSMDIARMAALDAGWSIQAPGVTLNRFCGSGQQAVNFAGAGIKAGFQDLVVAGGVESMSRPAPMHVDGFTANNNHLRDQYDMVPQGISADLIASVEGFSREELDQLAVDSQARAARAQAEGRFDRSLVPIFHDDGTLALAIDEHPRAGTTLEDLAKLQPSFAGMGGHVQEGRELSIDATALKAYPNVSEIRHVHHGGNSSGVVDGASALLLASPDYARAHGMTPRAKVTMAAVAGDEPVIMLTAPGPATDLVLRKAGMALSDIDLFEVNEAFAAVLLKWLRHTGADWDTVNVNGGAMALGHPIGATGGMLIGTVLDELERQDKETGLVTMCTGGGMATATIIQRV
ncbi:MAG: acetyl-CoA C-acetyltransferase [Acidimicrobiaceae bacterium]|nr:acetyl-CoA C-acetyltransferase [Ilumatobacter sp.]MCB9380817.1 acetyl-CoA C-acetyltransferase [Acidimicrobiaceae bacterium]MCO5329904.1 acetyl-CoA C-acetyltransferase [Ilumatobacteraceae bacterium]